MGLFGKKPPAEKLPPPTQVLLKLSLSPREATITEVYTFAISGTPEASKARYADAQNRLKQVGMDDMVDLEFIAFERWRLIMIALVIP